MWRRSFIINILMAAGIVLSAKQLVSAWEGFRASNSLERVVGKALVMKEASPGRSGEPAGSMHPLTDFMVVGERNLFTPERQPESESSAVGAPTPPPLPREPDLNGVTTLGGQRRAFLTIYKSKKSKGKSETVSVGDSLQGYQVSEIRDTSLTMKWNDHTVTIELSTQRAQQAAAAPKTMGAVTIITVGSAVAAVQTTQSAAESAEEQKGLQVGVVGSQAGRGTGSRQGGMRQGGRGMGRGGRGTGLGQDSRGTGASGRRGLPSTVGVGRGRQGIGTQQTIPSGGARSRRRR